MQLWIFVLVFWAFPQIVRSIGPFFLAVNETEHIIGNDIWNITIGYTYGTKLYYKNHDCVGNAVGHYVSYNGALDNLNWTSAAIYKKTSDFLDVVFTANEGDFHWVIFPDLAGSYQYFVNRALPILGEFRTLFRLDNTTYFNGNTNIKDGPLPTLAQIANSTKVQDETWETTDGAYITKYDWADFIRTARSYGVYGPGFGSWYINIGKDDYNGDQLKQELMVHRESLTGDVVQLNMLHGTHFMASSSDSFAIGKIWGPWLWYMNEGSSGDARRRALAEQALYPYAWFDNAAYHSRGEVIGSIKLSDGRLAKGVAIFLGDNRSDKSSLDMGDAYYYTTYADENGNFNFTNVRSGVYALHAWSNGGDIRDVSTVLIVNDVSVMKDQVTNVGQLIWQTQARAMIFQVGDMDRKSLGFHYGGAPHEHALVTKCPANLIHIAGQGNTIEWCFAQSALGTWTIKFNLHSLSTNTAAVLSVSLAGYSSGVSSNIILNNSTMIGTLNTGQIPSDPCLYRSATTAGEWHYFEFLIIDGLLRKGWNTIDFTVTKTTLWHGFMWDSIMLGYSNIAK